jgi:hypothetical protein
LSKVKIKRISYDNEQLEGYINPINALLRVLSQDKPVPYQTELADLSMTIDSCDFVDNFYKIISLKIFLVSLWTCRQTAIKKLFLVYK